MFHFVILLIDPSLAFGLVFIVLFAKDNNNFFLLGDIVK